MPRRGAYRTWPLSWDRSYETWAVWPRAYKDYHSFGGWRCNGLPDQDRRGEWPYFDSGIKPFKVDYTNTKEVHNVLRMHGAGPEMINVFYCDAKRLGDPEEALRRFFRWAAELILKNNAAYWDEASRRWREKNVARLRRLELRRRLASEAKAEKPVKRKPMNREAVKKDNLKTMVRELTQEIQALRRALTAHAMEAATNV